MSLTQFAMVEELAFLIKDNLPCKHLVLSMEEALVEFLQDDPSADGVLELEPMNSYSRLLLHRLADIFGFSHQSVGEGDDRHLLLECCPETSMPSILVSDFLWNYDEFQSPTTSQLLSRRGDASPDLKEERPNFQISLEEREAAYLAARERIFAADEGGSDEPVKQKPRSNPVVARRMIAHALGQRIKPPNQVVCNTNECTIDFNIRDKKEGAANTTLETFQETNIPLTQKSHPRGKPKISEPNGSTLSDTDGKVARKPADKMLTKIDDSGPRNIQRKANLKDEHIGAAKRMFANALGLQSTIHSKGSEIKHTKRENSV